jgi:hypothetical protein
MFYQIKIVFIYTKRGLSNTGGLGEKSFPVMEGEEAIPHYF